MNCPKCGLPNPETAQFCMRCGRELIDPNTVEPADQRPCFKHPKVLTQLSCGRCNRAVCTKCVILGPAGPRCKECAKLNVPIRPGAVVHTATRGIMGIFRSGPWSIYIWILLIGMVVSAVRGCMIMGQPIPRKVIESRDNEPKED